MDCVLMNIADRLFKLVREGVVAFRASDAPFCRKLIERRSAKRAFLAGGNPSAPSALRREQASEDRIERSEIAEVGEIVHIREMRECAEFDLAVLFKLRRAFGAERIFSFLTVYIFTVENRSFIFFAFFAQHNYYLSFPLYVRCNKPILILLHKGQYNVPKTSFFFSRGTLSSAPEEIEAEMTRDASSETIP